MVFGASSDKHIAAVIAELAPVFNKVVVTASRNLRAMALARLKDEFCSYGMDTYVTQDTASALKQALSLAGENGLVCVTGSLFVVAEALEQPGASASCLE
jgi:dihydrofolate synthase/folylpolyglutamate synthase